MLGQHPIEFDVSDLVAVQGEEGLIVNVTAYREPKPFTCPPSHSMDAVLDIHSKPCAIPKDVEYLLFQIGDTHHEIRNHVWLDLLHNPLKEPSSASFDETIAQVFRYG